MTEETIFAIQSGLLVLIFVGVLIAVWRVSKRATLDDSQLRLLTGAAERSDKAIRDETARMRNEAEEQGKNLRGEVREQITGFGDSLRLGIEGNRSVLDQRLDGLTKAQGEAADKLRFEMRQSVAAFGEGLKGDVTGQIKQFTEVLGARLSAMDESLAKLAQANAEAQDKLRATVEARLEILRKDNETKLEQMRATVDEKLQGTLETRLGESFKQVSERLAEVHRGLGEMQGLASGVGDLKRVLTNVKTRGTWAEVQLGALLEAMLTPEQYAQNVEVVPGSGRRVEYAIRLPHGPDDGPTWLPIDCKFPIEDYERLITAQEAGDAPAVEFAARAVEGRVRQEARRIRDKYIAPPATTDFALLYLPTEGLFAEVIRRAGLMADLQTSQRITIVGPTTLAALLNSLQMGFRTLAIQQRSSEVWRVLGEAKAEFEKYGEVWDKLGKQLATAQNTVQEAGTRTRAVARKLRGVEALEAPAPSNVALPLLDFDDDEAVG